MLLVFTSVYLNLILRYKFLILDAYLPDIYICVSTGVQIRGYFPKPKGAGERNVWEALF